MSTTNEHRSEVRVAFARVDEEARRCLQSMWPVVEPRLDEILNRFYSHIVKQPELAALVGDRQASLESAQKKHWKRLFTGAFDDDYVKSIDRIQPGGEEAREVTTSTGRKAVVGPRASFGTLSSGGLY